MNKIRVCVFSHIRFFSESLSAFLKSHKEISEVATYYQADHLVEEVVNFSPDIVLIDEIIRNNRGQSNINQIPTKGLMKCKWKYRHT